MTDIGKCIRGGIESGSMYLMKKFRPAEISPKILRK